MFWFLKKGQNKCPIFQKLPNMCQKLISWELTSTTQWLFARAAHVSVGHTTDRLELGLNFGLKRTQWQVTYSN